MNASKYSSAVYKRGFALWKLLLSYRKQDWDLRDYPVVIKEQPIGDANPPARLKVQPFMAFVVNWAGLAGTGDTRQDALADLQKNFTSAKAAKHSTGEPLPRPGTDVPIQFASTNRVRVHDQLADDFIHRVLELDWAFISDESSLWDFHERETNDLYIAKIRDLYAVDVSDISSARLYEILDRIAESKKSE